MKTLKKRLVLKEVRRMTRRMVKTLLIAVVVAIAASLAGSGFASSGSAAQPVAVSIDLFPTQFCCPEIGTWQASDRRHQ
jgi:hypothetical protein